MANIIDTMRTINISYWIITVLFAGFMLFSAIGNARCDEQSIKFMHDGMGYPVYIIPFLGYAKIAGVIGILVPGFTRIKEWAYAGLTFDLVGATYSFIALGGAWAGSGLIFMFLTIGVGLVSYVLYHKRLKAKTIQA